MYLDKQPVLIIAVDGNLKIIWSNQYFSKKFNLSDREFVGNTINSVFVIQYNKIEDFCKVLDTVIKKK